MSDRTNARVVYSTGAGRICPTCGEPVEKCGGRHDVADEPLPSRIVAKLRIEKKGRGGKTVTVIDGLPRNAPFLNELCQELKRAAGCGGAVTDGTVELQGDMRERARSVLSRRGYTIKG
jgi:translation initiation factor 1